MSSPLAFAGRPFAGWVVGVWLCAGCSAPADPAVPSACEALYTGGPGPTEEADIQALLDDALTLFPALDGVSIALNANVDPTSFYSANLELATLADPPLQRDYLVNWSTLQLDDPPPHDAVIAILGHELSHLTDYLQMDGAELAEFGVWYATSDVSDYERGTDLVSMELGCGVGLILFRLWLYAHVDAETEAQKRIDYWTPDEIATWLADPAR